MTHGRRLLAAGFLALTIQSAPTTQSRIVALDGSPLTPASIDAAATRLMTAAHVTGLGLALIADGEVVFEKAYGSRDVERNLPLTPQTVMASASLTKAAVACLALQLAAENVIRLDTPVSTQLPQPLATYPNYGDLAGDPRADRITPAMLLSHTAGFANFRAFEPDRRLHIHFEPGNQYAYSGEGLLLLQFLIESVAARPLEALMQERVFGPLGMSRTGMVWQERFESDFALGYNEQGRSLGAQRRTRADAAGSMQTTLHDYSLFLAAVLRGDVPPPALRARMLTPQIRIRSPRQFPTLAGGTTDANDAIRLSYGLGWGLYWTPLGNAFFKEGHDEGWRHYAVAFEETHAGFLIVTNSSNGEGIFQELLETVFKNPHTPVAWEGFVRYQDALTASAAPPRPIVVVRSDLLDRYVGRYGDPSTAVLVVRRSSDHLSIQENDEPPQELFGADDATFFSTVADDVFTFDVDATGRAGRVVLRTGGRDVSLKRLD